MANIAFLSDLFPAGGVERVTMNLAKPLVDMGHKVYLFVSYLNTEQLPKEDLSIEYVKLPSTVHRQECYPHIVGAIKKHNIDVLISPAIYPRYMPQLYAEKLCKVVFVLHSCPFYEDKLRYNMIHNSTRRSLGYLFENWFISYPKFKLGYYHRRALKRYKTIYNNCDAFGVLFDDYGKQIARALGVESHSSKIVTLINPTEPQATEGVEGVEREKIVAYIGRLSTHDKRVDRLLKVWHKIYDKHPDWRLWIVGSGEAQSALERYVADNNLPRVEFLGFLSEVDDIYKKSSIVCLTSDFEGCPMVLLEAQNWGCATIAFDCSSGVREILSPNMVNGVYVKNGDIDGYAEALSRLMGDDELRGSIQRQGIENIKRFYPEVTAGAYNALIERLLSEK